MSDLGRADMAHEIRRLSQLLDALDRKLDDALLGIEVLDRKIETLRQEYTALEDMARPARQA